MSLVLSTITDRVVTISMNRPEVYNALTPDLIEALISAFKDADSKDAIDYIIFKGEGKGFCAGLDLQWALTIQSDKVVEIVEQYFNVLTTAIHLCSKPVICLLHGPASGAGASLVLACDLIFASEHGSLAFPFLGLGLQPDTGMAYYLKQRVGYHQAFEWLLEGKKLTIDEAVNHKLVQKKFTDETMMSDYLGFYLKSLSQLQTGAGKSLKSLLIGQSSFEETLKKEAQQQALAVKGGMLKIKIEEFFKSRR
ncbi:enoyl-CoA hydratase/isomerase family protein [Cytophaga aurantiaca]|uniref:enoyl-CoA hydratase/isomerase family protein n=1 Tax=Cytophaga aurantiaca TaxID=29530 RepID=UPI000374ECC4|nr:enoyl-CoA hydratase/isomerase family protein [Cytophaga aurantiaca]